jgi:aminoglycoside 6-adenylyltransferase
MRSEQAVLSQLLAFANQHAAVRAVVMNGSRVNPNAPVDFFQDYDVVCFVPDPRHFLQDQAWIQTFGDLVILQQNDFEAYGKYGYIFLMLFSDGVRIDLSFQALENLAYIGEDSLTRVLLDKDGRAPALPPSADTGYYTPRPSRKQFDEAVNEIFWCSNNIAKGIWRGELVYVKYMFDTIVRLPITQLLEWYAASQHGWAVTTGAYGKWLQRYLPAEIWEQIPATYAGADFEQNWDALFAALRLVRQIGQAAAVDLGYTYPLEDDRRVVAYLEHVRALPVYAKSFDG